MTAIIIYHDKSKVVEVEFQGKQLTFDVKSSISQVLKNIAKQFPNDILVWCNHDLKSFLNKDNLESLFQHQKMMLSYCPNNNFFGDNIGFVEESPFINVNKKVRFPTWQMSSCAGAMYAKVLLEYQLISTNSSFDYYLNSISKLGMPQGLFCYSEPQLLSESVAVQQNIATNFEFFKFVKQHYKTRWTFLLFLNMKFYKNEFLLFSFLKSLFFFRRKIDIKNFQFQAIASDVKTEATFDVLIPTIGRKIYLYNFLKDLNQQTLLPTNVIIVEQNPLLESLSELDFLTSEKWNFNIKHTFTNQAGACNARNIAINQIESFWTFLADDDIAIAPDFLQHVFDKLQETKTNAATINCHLENEKQVYFNVVQWSTFGSGCSFVITSELKKCNFRKGFEFGFGEDADFGMQMRNLGNDVLYFPNPKILHYKAPIGGLRTRPILRWQNDIVQPKPSPTVMLYMTEHNTAEQIAGYKTILFFKFYKHQKIKNPILYYNYFKKQWIQSVFWANELKKIQ